MHKIFGKNDPPGIMLMKKMLPYVKLTLNTSFGGFLVWLIATPGNIYGVAEY